MQCQIHACNNWSIFCSVQVIVSYSSRSVSVRTTTHALIYTSTNAHYNVKITRKCVQFVVAVVNNYDFSLKYARIQLGFWKKQTQELIMWLKYVADVNQ